MFEVVIRGYIIPYIVDNEVKYVDRLYGINLIEIFKKIFDKVKDDYIKEFGKLKSAEDVNNLLNMFTIYMKSLLYIDPIMDGDNVIIASPISNYYEYYIKKIKRQVKPIYTREGLKQYLAYLTTKTLEKKGGAQSIFKAEDIFNLLKMPADTRPAANTSALILHLLTTSAIASSIYISHGSEEGVKPDELAKIRLLSLFHDLGKFIRWSKHEEISAKKLEEWMLDGEFIEKGSEAWYIVEDVITLISEHPKDNKLYSIFKEADILSSGFDRLLMFLPITLSKSTYEFLLKNINTYFKTKYDNLEDALNNPRIRNNWEFWNEYLSLDDKERLTIEFCKYVSKISSESGVAKLLILSEGNVVSKDIMFIRVDIRKIQEYIKTNNLKAIMGGSRIIDLVIYASIPDLLIDLALPYECILLYGGGNLTAIVPSKLLEKVMKQLDKLDVPGIRISIGYSSFYENYAAINREIERTLTLNKVYGSIQEEKPFNVKDSIFKKCEFCGYNVAIYSITTIEKEVKVCESCKYKHEIGGEEYFIYKVVSYPKPKPRLEKFIELFREGDVLAYIAGHTIDEAIKHTEIDKYYNLAIVKLDGNLIGQFMSSSISITDAFERSVRTDFAVKRAVNEFYSLLTEVSGRDSEIPLKFILGFMYCGGDDGAFIMPAYLTVPFAILVLNKYFIYMGGKSTLSLSIVGAKPKHPIIPLYEASDELLKHAKNACGRDLTYKYIHSKSPDEVVKEFRAALAFCNIDTGRLSSEYVKDILNTAYMDRMSLQAEHPYILSSQEYGNSIYRLLEIILPNKDLNLDNIDDVTRDLLNKVCIDQEQFLDFIKHIRNMIEKTLSVSIAGSSDTKLKIAYIVSKGSSEFKLVEEKVIPLKSLVRNLLYIKDGRAALKMIDLEYLIKLLGGGREI